MIFSYLKQDGITKISIWVVMIFSYQDQGLVRVLFSGLLWIFLIIGRPE